MCGLLIFKLKYHAVNKILYFQSIADTITDLFDTVDQQVWELLNQKSTLNDNKIYKKLKRFLALCMDEGKEIH